MAADWFKPDVARIRIPLPFPLRWVNSYIIRGSDGFTLIDPGLHTTEAEQVWEKSLERLGIRYEDIERIVLTHHHPDHYGLAGWMQERSGADVWLSEEGIQQVEAMWKGSFPLNEQIEQLFLRHGMDDAALDKLSVHMESFVPQVTPHPVRLNKLNRKEPFLIGNRKCRIIDTPGHAYGHACFYEETAKEMFCGDHVLPRISPNISFIPGTDDNPLQSYLTSLEEIAAYDVSFAFPGHRDPFEAFAERTAALRLHHEQRLEQMTVHLRKPLSVYGLCRTVFGDSLTIHQLRFAMAETLAHVIYLHRDGRIDEREEDGMLKYQSI